MKQIIAMHGWGGDHQIWEPWKKYFNSHGWIWQNAERGYGKSKPNQPNWINSSQQNSQNQQVLICHSLGAHLIRKQILTTSTDIILINSFSSFIPKNREHRLLKTALIGMKKALGTSQEKQMLRIFLTKSCHPHSIDDFSQSPITKDLSVSGRKILQKDLELLIHTSGLPCGFPLEARVLKIAAKEDSIVSSATTNLLLQDLQNHLDVKPTSWIIDGVGHSFIKPEIIKRVKNWLEVRI